MPVWNTEYAWWSDGPANLYSQADKAARAMLWMRILGIERSSYLLLEGGYGDYGLTYSLVQASDRPDYVKPAALATMTAADELVGRPFVGEVETGIPHTFAAAFGARTGGADTLLAVWTDDLSITARLRADGATAVGPKTTDVLGATGTLDVASGDATVQLSGSPLYVVAPSGMTLHLGPVEAFGNDVGLASAGTRATASSAQRPNPPDAAIDGVSDASIHGDLHDLSAWASSEGNASPALTLTFAAPREVDRVLVVGHSNASVINGLRDVLIEIRAPDGGWTVVGSIRGQFVARMALVAFPQERATAIRLTVAAVNYGGLAGGAAPWFWTSGGQAVVMEVEAYEPD
jgi:hypothetical protein